MSTSTEPLASAGSDAARAADAAASAVGKAQNPHRSIIAILLVAAFVVILNETTMNVALSNIMADFGITERLAQWLTTGFMLTMAVVIPITGWLLDRLPIRALFTAAMTLFSLGTALCAVAPVFELLLAGRVVQASGTAIMMPLLMTTIMRLVDPKHRGAIMGTISMVISVAPAVGPTLSGVLLQLGSWRLIFATMLPIALSMLALGLWKLRNAGETKNTPLDVWSVLLTVLGFGPLIYGLSMFGDANAPFWEAPLAVGIGLAGLIGFVARQLALQKSDAALLDLRTFTYPTFTIALLMMALAMMALFGTIIMLPLLLQRSYGMEPLHVGLMMLPGGLAMGVLGPIVGRLFDRFGPRPLVIPASFVVLAVFLFFSTLAPSTPWWAVTAGHVAMSLSFAFVFTPLFTVALGSLPKRFYSHGSATVGTVQQVAGAAGTALFVTVFAMQTQVARDAGAAEGAALLAGSHWAFLGAGAVWTAAVITSFFLRKPADADA
ncbi:MAG: MDR family MFS transporter [Propioniciclava sp.]|uniref:MDR family MFS transporter n=1 Tax=Propioniciclava sp. TaxID=2038686 RepID=UPI0039E5F18A